MIDDIWIERRNRKRKKRLCVSQSLSFIPSLCHSLSHLLFLFIYLLFLFLFSLPVFLNHAQDRVCYYFYLLFTCMSILLFISIFLSFPFSICLSNAKKRYSQIIPSYSPGIILFKSPSLSLDNRSGGRLGGYQTEMTDKKCYTSPYGCLIIKLGHLTLDVSSLNLISQIFSIKIVLISM